MPCHACRKAVGAFLLIAASVSANCFRVQAQELEGVEEPEMWTFRPCPYVSVNPYNPGEYLVRDLQGQCHNYILSTDYDAIFDRQWRFHCNLSWETISSSGIYPYLHISFLSRNSVRVSYGWRNPAGPIIQKRPAVKLRGSSETTLNKIPRILNGTYRFVPETGILYIDWRDNSDFPTAGSAIFNHSVFKLNYYLAEPDDELRYPEIFSLTPLTPEGDSVEELFFPSCR
ncbi:MAG: hypothetical protein LUE26_09860 [Alistipes sp.]|nr:hypothetical protein [Alistipes sp.]